MQYIAVGKVAQTHLSELKLSFTMSGVMASRISLRLGVCAESSCGACDATAPAGWLRLTPSRPSAIALASFDGDGVALKEKGPSVFGRL
jgi:hypothetical protein